MDVCMYGWMDGWMDGWRDECFITVSLKVVRSDSIELPDDDTILTFVTCNKAVILTKRFE